ncbi:MAG: hypothetical protein K6F05_06955 [Succinivibrio sp.]|nr:hypothetical protein [Succinivibrio sp.]
MKNMLGFDAGVQIGNTLRNLLFTNNGMVIAHRIKGRRRYSCQALKGQPEVCRELEHELQDFPGMTSCKVNPITGSVTICYTCSEKAINALFDALSHQIAGKHAVQEETIIPTGVLTVADNVNDTFQNVKQLLTKFFNHTEPAFLTRIAGMILLIYGFNRVFNNGDRPSGPQILLWGLALLMRRSHPDPKLGGDDE